MRKKLLFFCTIFFLTLIIFGLVGTIYRTYLASRRIGDLEQQVQSLEEHGQKLAQELAQKDTLAFVEREARNKLGMVKPGERIVVLGKPAERQILPEEQERRRLAGLKNREKWWYLFFGSGLAP